MRRIALGLLLTGFSILVALVVAEVALRLLPLPDLRVLAAGEAPPAAAWKDPAWGDPPDRAFRRHRVIGHEHASNVDVQVPLAEHSRQGFRFKTNNLGLRRDRETSTDRPAGTRRVLLLGDSQTDGYVDNNESFATRLEASLASAGAGRRVEVLNAGVAGYSPAQEYLWHDVHGAELEPNLVIVIFYPGNDALDLLDQKKPNVDPNSGRVIRPREEEAQPEERGSLESVRLLALGRWLVQAGPLAMLWSQQRLPGALTEAGGYSADALTQVFRTCHGCFLQSLQQAGRARRDPRAMQEAIQRAAGILLRLDQDVAANGGRFAVAILPTRRQVEPELAAPGLRTTASLLGLSEADLSFDDVVADSIRARLEPSGVPVISLRDALRQAAGGESLYYSRDWHLNSAGHTHVADVLAREISSRGLLER